MRVILILYILMNLLVIALVLSAKDAGMNFSFVNPIVIYKDIKVNWFGAILLAIIINIFFPIISIPYWIYKICTVGRR